jgi:hypothetical protein
MTLATIQSYIQRQLHVVCNMQQTYCCAFQQEGICVRYV